MLTAVVERPVFRHHQIAMAVDWKAAGRRVEAARKRAFPQWGGLTAAAKVAGLGKGQWSRFEQGQAVEPSYDTIVAMAEALDVRPEWICTGEGPERRAAFEDLDMPIGTFQLKIGDESKRGLREAIAEHPTRWRLSTVAKALKGGFQSNKDGQPMRGWIATLDELEGLPEEMGTAKDLQARAAVPTGLPRKPARK